MNFRQKYFALLLCHSTFEMFSITLHFSLLFFSVRAMEEAVIVIFAMIVTASNTEILDEHTVNHIFQYPNGEAVHPVIKNFEDFQKIQNYVGSGLTAKEIVAKISKLQETGGYSSLTSKIKGECKLNCMPFPQLFII